MPRLRLATALTATAFVVLAGCGSSSNDSSTTKAADESTSSTAAASMATVQLQKTSLGEVLADEHGRTLYMFTKDAGGKSACSGPCASIWPALTVTGKPSAGQGLEEEDLGTITRDDGKTQVTYYGHPLYTYSSDSKAGDVNGQNVGGVWFAVTAEGEKAGSSSSPSTTSAPAGGGGY